MEDKKQGNSDHFDRIDLLESFINIFDKARIDCVMGDREFIGKHWIEWLESKKIPYNLRIKESGQYIANAQGIMVKSQLLFGFLKPNQYVNLGRRKIGKTNGYEVFVSAIRSSAGELVVLIHCSTISDPCELYRQRWQIEVLFRAIKAGGFNLEDIHITDFDRLDTLLGIVAIACCLAYRMGDMVVTKILPTLKKHGYKPKSFIHYGLDIIQNAIRKECKKITEQIFLFFTQFWRGGFPFNNNFLVNFVL